MEGDRRDRNKRKGTSTYSFVTTPKTLVKTLARAWRLHEQMGPIHGACMSHASMR